jgi:hypothetical protein
MTIRRAKLTNFMEMEAAMKRSRVATTAIPLLIGIALLLSACAEGADYRGGYGYPAYSSFYGGGWEGWHHGWDHGHWDGHRDFGHEGHGGWRHGFSGHAGFGGRGGGGGHSGGHGGGGHGGGGHR